MASTLFLNTFDNFAKSQSDLSGYYSMSDSSPSSSSGSSLATTPIPTPTLPSSNTISSICNISNKIKLNRSDSYHGTLTKQHSFTEGLSAEPPAEALQITDTATSLKNNSIVKNIKNVIGPAAVAKPQLIDEHKIDDSISSSTQPQCSQFIDVLELKNKLFNFPKFLIIFLDCRTYTDFNLKHIKDSVHLNCRDKLTRKRLQSRKLTVKDLISSEEIKNKFDEEDVKDEKLLASNTKYSPAGFTSSAIGSLMNAAMATADYTSKFINKLSSEDACPTKNDTNNMIVIYDDTSSDLKDLQSEQNPLKIVQENIKQSGYKKECKILKGGFKQFFETCPELCVLKEASEQQRIFLARQKEFCCDMRDDQRQSAIDNAVMTEITPYLFLGNEIDAKNCDSLARKGIFYILNVTKNVPFYDCTNSNGSGLPKFITKRIAVNDCENQNLKNHFEEASEFIDQAKLKNQKVLVHCQAGISRSPTIIIAYLMSRFNLTMNDAYNQVKEQRPIISPNLIFMSQLMDYGAKLACNNPTQPEIKIRPATPPSTPIMQSIEFTSSSTSAFKFQSPSKPVNNLEHNTILVYN